MRPEGAARIRDGAGLSAGGRGNLAMELESGSDTGSGCYRSNP